jgi:AcrR family transcriptional regulator
MSTEKVQGSPRERLLAAASQLFYEEGIHTVGIERVLERAGVAKASLYSTFGSKEELVRAYLLLRAERRQRRISERLARIQDPRERVLAVFDVLGEVAAEPGFRGCAFVNASAEGPRNETKVASACADIRGWLRTLFVDLAQAAGAADPTRLAGELVLLYDGATVGAAMDRDPARARVARTMAAQLLDAAAPPERRKRRPAAGKA